MPSKEIMDYYGCGRMGYAWRYAWRYLLWQMADHCPIRRWRTGLYRAMGMRIGKDVYIGHGVIVDRSFPQLISVGDHAAIGDRCIVTAHRQIPTDTPLKVLYPFEASEVRVGDGAWVMPGCVIVAGVTIGDHAVVATGAVVTHDVPPHTMVAGTPARVVKSLAGTYQPTN